MEIKSREQLKELSAKELKSIASEIRECVDPKHDPSDLWEYSNLVKEIMHAKEILEK